MTVGKESIRVWRAKDTFDHDAVLSGHSLFLGEHARENTFTDFTVVERGQKALVVSSLGCLYIIDLTKKEVIGVF